MRLRKRTIAVAVISLAAGFWLGWSESKFVAQDRCLDAGGAWNYAGGVCTFDNLPGGN